MEQPNLSESKKIGRRMSVLMGITLSFFLSLAGTLMSGHFTLAGWLISFAASTAVSLLIGLLVPMKPLTDALHSFFSIRERSFAAWVFDSLVSDILYTPAITFCMVLLAYKMAVSHGALLNFLPMFLHSLLVCFILGFALIFIFMRLFLLLLLRGAKGGNGQTEPEK